LRSTLENAFPSIPLLKPTIVHQRAFRTLRTTSPLGEEWWVSIRPENRGADSKPIVRKPVRRFLQLARHFPSSFGRGPIGTGTIVRWMKWKMENERRKMENAFPLYPFSPLSLHPLAFASLPLPFFWPKVRERVCANFSIDWGLFYETT